MPRAKPMPSTADDIETAFYDALTRADVDALMALWADDEEIVCIHPGAPRLIGHAAIRASWEAIFERGGVHIRPTRVHTSYNVMSSVHNVVEEVLQRDGGPRDVHILATNVYLKTTQGWRMVVHHASVAPGEMTSAETTSGTLH